MKIRCFQIVTLFASLFFLSPSALAEPANLAQLFVAVKNYHDSGDYQKELTQVIKQAEVYIKERVANNNKQPHPSRLALVLDIDETSLSNYDKMVMRNFIAPSKEQLHNETLAGDDPVIQPTLALYKYALKHGIDVFFITGRKEDERVATQKNLVIAGYTGWKGLFLRPAHYHEKSASIFKSKKREEITKLGYTIIASIGDQQSDIDGGYAEKGFKLPNPYYYLP